MFKLFKKQKNVLTSTKKRSQQKKDDKCPMCHVSDEVINNLKGKKEEGTQDKNHKSCCE